MDSSILITSGFGVAVVIATVAILVNNQVDVFLPLKISILFFSLDWIFLSAIMCLLGSVPTWDVIILQRSIELVSFLIWLFLFLGQFFLLFGFYLLMVAFGKEKNYMSGSDKISNGTGPIS